MSADMLIVPFKGKGGKTAHGNELSNMLRKHFDAFVKHMKYNRGLALNSVKAHKTDVLQFIEYICVNDVIKLDFHKIENYIVYLQDDKKNAPRTANRKMDSLRLLFKYLHYQDIIKDNPMSKIESIRTAERLPEFLTAEEVRKLLDVIPKNSESKYRDYALILTFLKTGLRVSEVTNLRVSDIDFKNRFLKVRVKGGRERMIRLSKELKFVLTNYISKCRGDYLEKEPLFISKFGNGLSRQMVFRIVKYNIEKAGIKKRVSTHTLRHTFATDLVRKGAGLLFVKEALNHKNIATTQIYTHLSQDDYNDKYDELVA